MRRMPLANGVNFAGFTIVRLLGSGASAGCISPSALGFRRG
jgi:hypothetical protein